MQVRCMASRAQGIENKEKRTTEKAIAGLTTELNGGDC